MTESKFQRFQATRRFVADLASLEHFHDAEISGPGFTYLGDNLHVSIDKEGSFSTIICNTNPVGWDLNLVEQHVFEWAVDEGIYDDFMSDFMPRMKP